MQKVNQNGWTYLYSLSKGNDDARKMALIRGYAWIEHALHASGLKNVKGRTAKKLLIAREKGLLNPNITEDVLRVAIETRHKATHEDTVPEAGRCFYCVSVFERIWKSLKDTFVSFETANKIAEEILSKDGVHGVSIYGSLARPATTPNDIDFLVFDNGRFSEQEQEQDDTSYESSIKRTTHAWHILELDKYPYQAIVKCRWLDITIINEVKLGNDSRYTQDLIGHQ